MVSSIRVVRPTVVRPTDGLQTVPNPRRKVPAIHRVVRLVRRDERTGKRKDVAVRRGLQRVLGGRRRREERIGVGHHLRDPVADDLRRRGAGVTVVGNPVEPPVERAHNAIRGDRCEPALPGVEEGLKHPPRSYLTAYPRESASIALALLSALTALCEHDMIRDVKPPTSS